MAEILACQNLTVKVKGETVVDQLNLSLKAGQVEAVLGPNAAGKSSLLKAIMGLSAYRVTQGRIIFENQPINDLTIKERADLGISLIYQQPPAINGLKIGDLLAAVKGKASLVESELEEQLLERELNVGFSGGEQKIAELLQVKHLEPQVLLIDEIDSGLDLINLKTVARAIKKVFLKNQTAVLLVTHRGEIMRFLKPATAHVMLEGKIVCSEPWKKVWQTIKKYGYEQCRQCLK